MNPQGRATDDATDDADTPAHGVHLGAEGVEGVQGVEDVQGAESAEGFQGAEEPDEPPDPTRPLNQPARWGIVAAEVVATVLLLLLAVWAWRRASVPVELPDYDNPAIPQFVERLSGPWVAAAVGAVLACGLLLLDALRHAVLAVRAGRAEPPDSLG